MIVQPAGAVNQTPPAQERIGDAYEAMGSPQEFMTLLLTQLRNQDPLNPQDQTQFLTELAQLQSVAELRALNEHIQMWSAMSLLGHEVDVAVMRSDQEGAPLTVTGTVRSVSPSREGPVLIVSLPDNGGELAVTVGDVLAVRHGE